MLHEFNPQNVANLVWAAASLGLAPPQRARQQPDAEQAAAHADIGGDAATGDSRLAAGEAAVGEGAGAAGYADGAGSTATGHGEAGHGVAAGRVPPSLLEALCRHAVESMQVRTPGRGAATRGV